MDEVHCVEMNDFESTIKDLKQAFNEETNDESHFIAYYNNELLKNDESLKDLPVTPNDGNDQIVFKYFDGTQTCLFDAMWCNDINTCRLCIDGGVDLNKQDCDGHTALHDAIEYANTDICALVIAAGADVNAEDKAWKATPLEYTLKADRSDVFKLLMHAGASTLNYKGNNILDRITEQNHPNIYRMLLDEN